MFLLLYITVYGGLNAYGWYKACRALQARPSAWILSACAVAALVVLPIVVSLLAHRLPHGAARLLAFAAFIWMAYAFWFAFSQVAVDLWNGGVTMAGRAQVALQAGTVTQTGNDPAARWRISRKAGCAIGLAWLGFASVWGFAEAGQVRLRTIRLASDRLPAHAAPIRLLQVSDLHVGRTMRASVVERVLRLMEEARPDVLVCTGDLVDDHGPEVESIMARLAAVPAPLGKYAVIGNHEVYPGLDTSVALVEAAGFTLLRQRGLPVGSHLWLAGVDDPAVGSDGAAAAGDIAAPTEARIPILLKHQPTVNTAHHGLFDLQLSGHVHGGQIFPFGLFTRAAYPFRSGKLHALESGGFLYVTPGTGTWGPPFRLFAPPELVLFEWHPAAAGQGTRPLG